MKKLKLNAFALSVAAFVFQPAVADDRYAITVTEHDIVMGDLVGQSEVIYSQRLGEFLVRNNIQGREPFRNIGCPEKVDLVTTPEERLNWIANIEKAYRGFYADGSKGKTPYIFQFTLAADAKGTEADHLKRVQHAVATRQFDGFVEAKQKLESGHRFCKG